ncbi:MAG TPA: preQ(1) synthase [Bacteroidota bacterium]|nr:preQ(1) synthase [Bacteroidota bacterium]
MEKNQPVKGHEAHKSGTAIAPLDKRFDVEPESAINPDVLETFPYEYPHKEMLIEIDTDEFTAVCPYSGLPDFGTIKVHYVPDKVCIELRSFKYYLLSYRSVGIYQEHAVNRMLKDLVRVAKPRWMQVIADYKVRGGVHTVTSVEWGKKKLGSS